MKKAITTLIVLLLLVGSASAAQFDNVTIRKNLGVGGNINVTGNGTIGGDFNIAGNITGDVSLSGNLSVDGTAEINTLAVTNDTLVSNLNADKLDNQSGAYYTNASNLNAGTVPAARLNSYDSGWYLAANTTKTHNLNTTKVVARLYGALDANGLWAGEIFNTGSSNCDVLYNITNTTVDVYRAAGGYVWNQSAPTFTIPTYHRIIMIPLE